MNAPWPGTSPLTAAQRPSDDEGQSVSTGDSAVRESGRARRPRLRRTMAVLRFTRTFGRTLGAAWDQDATERAAALTYYAVLALFPALLMTVTLMGLAGGGSDSGLTDGLTTLLPAQSRPVVASALQQMAEDRSATVSVAVVGGLGAVWSACSYASVFRRALHTMSGTEDHRPAWRTAPRVVITSVTLLVLLVCSAVCLVVSGELARRTGTLLHMSGPVIAAWRSLRWPLLVFVAALLVLILFRSGPRAGRSLRSLAPGGALAVALWLLASAGFAAYTSRMGTYNRLYGPLAGTVVFLVWLWFSNLSLMIGAHFNAERSRAVRPVPEPADPAAVAVADQRGTKETEAARDGRRR
jgi:membrane protein